MSKFTQPDPIGLAGGLNLYGYADGDPINNSDPFGLCPGKPGCPTGNVNAGTAIGVLGALSSFGRSVNDKLPSTGTVTAQLGPVSVQFGGDRDASVTVTPEVGFYLTADATWGASAGELGSASYGGNAGLGIVGGATVNRAPDGRVGATISIGVGGAVPVSKALELGDLGRSLLRWASRAAVGAGADAGPAREAP